ncbi:MAG: MarR family transcriptional regulator [Candidatus Latescibacterota bacterium]|jgi:DNA-binding MarR family transcriptional regulator
MLNLETEIIAAIRRIMRAIELRSRQLLDQTGVTGPQLAALQLAAQIENASASAISRHLHLSRSTVTGVLDRLQNRGLIRRNQNARDRRGNVIEVTPRGRDLLASAPPLLQDQFRQKLEQLEDWEQTSILAALQRLAAMMDAEALPVAAVLDTATANSTAAEDDE